MCDERQVHAWAKGVLSRRGFGTGMMAGAAAACMPVRDAASAGEAPGGLGERSVAFAAPGGTMDGFFVYPASGRAPGVIFWPDIAGLREAKRQMARRLAGEGYAVLVVNPYYRDVAGQQFSDFASFAAAGGFQMVRPWREKLTSEAVQGDARAAVAWLDAQAAVDTARGIGTQGYCMGGPFTVWSAAASPRVKAAASFHGGGLVRENTVTSPHRMLQVGKHYLIAIAQDDDAKEPEDKTALRRAAVAADAEAVIEVYAGDHGWTVPDSPAYDRDAAERAYADHLKMYRSAL